MVVRVQRIGTDTGGGGGGKGSVLQLWSTRPVATLCPENRQHRVTRWSV